MIMEIIRINQMSSKSRLINFVLILVFAVSSVGFVYLSFFDTPKNNSQPLNISSDSLFISQVNGDSLDLAELNSKVIIVNFWATWCGPCLVEIPELIDIQDKYDTSDVQIIGISVDDNEAIVKRFMNINPFNYPVAMDNYAMNQKFGPVTSIPSTFVLDNSLTILHKFRGYQKRETIEAMIISLLKNG